MLFRKRRIIIYSVIVIIFFTAGIYIASFIIPSSEKIINRTQIVMGTVAEIKIINENVDVSNNAINFAFNEIKRIEKIFSTYEKNNNIWEINHSDKNKIKLDKELYNFILVCDSIWRLTNGSFDPSLGSITLAWGFNGDNPTVPQKKKLNLALANSGWKNIEIYDKGIIKKKNIQLDFGSIAKGYAVDKAIDIIKSFGINKALVNIGGEVKGIGKDWQVGIKHPRVINLLLSKIKLNNYGIATSGDYEKYFFENGERYSHIFNPLDGYPANKCRSVSVINKNVMFADALSTACFVIGPIEGIKLINKLPDTECLIIDKKGKEYKSKGFDEFRVSSQ
ncbi:MAG: FAD:protein FMN transferase [Bacteroidetes bacterium]|nr:FAD:protein FMN transferase [Bacteroidota bacterium]